MQLFGSSYVKSDETGEMFPIVPVEASAVVVISSTMGSEADARRKRVEEAMVKAAEAARASGVQDPDNVRALMLAARDAVLEG